MNLKPSNRPGALALALAIAMLAGLRAPAVTPDELAALREKAAAGSVAAQYDLGLVYLDRQEAAYDPAEAYAWMQRAADNGAAGISLDALFARLGPRQAARATRLLEELRANSAPAKPARPPVAPAAISPVSAAPGN
ncbi:MAG: SEL1-like repeat protein, partial [Opitutaceae bacterium]|nr:SEL1-like repeat protein [Opitutaceae bacterium]